MACLRLAAEIAVQRVAAVAAAALVWTAGILLAVSAARRGLLTVGIFLRSMTPPSERAIVLPGILVVTACRDEAGEVAELCNAVSQLTYPSEKLRVLLIDDGSRDRTGETMQRYAAGRPNWSFVRTPRTVGKAAALNAGLESCGWGDIVYVLDADHRPHPDALVRLAAYFENVRVAGVSGRTVARNAFSSAAAYYSAIEADIHQLVTTRAKDRLDLGPALLGSNCAYRRSMLEKCGGFPSGALLEDYDLTLNFYAAGYCTRFAEDVIASHEVPLTIDGYTKQHMRWGRGFIDIMRDHTTRLLSARGMPWKLRVELVLSGTGYVDRLAFLAAVVLNVLARFRPNVPVIRPVIVLAAIAMPMVQVIALLMVERAPRAVWVRLPLIPLFVIFDVSAAVRSSVDALLRRPRTWSRTARCGDCQTA